MSLLGKGWSNKTDISDKDCDSGSWKQHWINYSVQPWPNTCSVAGCGASATQGAHVCHPDYAGDRIAPMCDECHQEAHQLRFKKGTALVSAGPTKFFH